MNIIFLSSENIYLRPLSIDDDLTNYASWLNDQDTTHFMGSGRFPLSPYLLKDYIERMNSSKNDFLLGIFLRENSQHIGNLTVESIDWVHRKGELGIVIGEKACLGKGYATEAVDLVLKHCFERLNINKITAGVVAPNVPSRKLFEKCGFTHEGTMRKEYYLEHGYHDVYRYGLLIDEFKNTRFC